MLKYNGEHHMTWTSANNMIPQASSGGYAPKLREGCKNRLFVETFLYLHILSQEKKYNSKEESLKKSTSFIKEVVFNV